MNDKVDCTLETILEVCIRRLERAGVYSPEGDMRKIVEFVSGKRSPPLGLPLSATELQAIETLVGQREVRKPLPRLFGHASFYGLRLKTHDGVFLPYSETEVLVDIAGAYCQDHHAALRVLDVGTGSGCLLLALLSMYPNATGVGVDCDPLALRAASENALNLGLGDRARFQNSDWTSGIAERFDLVVSNPPRVPSKMVSRLLPEMRDFDPRTAYDGGSDGMAFFRRIADDFDAITEVGGVGIFQVSDASAVTRIMRRRGLSDVHIHNNYVGIPTAVAVRRP